MTHTIHPFSHRLGILRDWKSRWFARGKGKARYREYLKADTLLREYLETKLKGMMVDSIDIERGENSMRIAISTARPGLIIGRQGEGATTLREDIKKKMRKIGAEVPKNLKLDIVELRSPESHAAVVGAQIAEAIEKRMPFRRVIKQAMEKMMANKDVKGAKITISGRLNGAEMGRTEHLIKGKLPLQTFRADIDYAKTTAHYPGAGAIGVKVWIYRGEVFNKDKKDSK